MWQLPLFPEYEEINESPIADMKNAGGREASAIGGGIFLQQFVEKGVPWAHVDIAGTALLPKDKPYQAKGATGVGVRTMLNLVLALDHSQSD
jgi:leucyl aminopeptidase